MCKGFVRRLCESFILDLEQKRTAVRPLQTIRRLAVHQKFKMEIEEASEVASRVACKRRD
jgi:hypothetical protein